MNELIKVDERELGSEVVKTVNARELHKFLLVGKDFTTWIKDRISKYDFVENQDFIIFPGFGENPTGLSGRPSTEYFLTLDMAKEISMVERSEKGKEARQYFIECERIALDKSVVALPATYVEALRALANEVEVKELALAERDKAIKTKAEIGNKREATAMATASHATKKVKQLEIALDRNKEYATVKKVEMMFPGRKFPWKLLKDYSKLHRYTMPKVPDQNYGEVNSYHADVWFNVYGVEIC